MYHGVIQVTRNKETSFKFMELGGMYFISANVS